MREGGNAKECKTPGVKWGWGLPGLPHRPIHPVSSVCYTQQGVILEQIQHPLPNNKSKIRIQTEGGWRSSSPLTSKQTTQIHSAKEIQELLLLLGGGGNERKDTAPSPQLNCHRSFLPKESYKPSCGGLQFPIKQQMVYICKMKQRIILTAW